MSVRMINFDYSTPYHYMVTIKCRHGRRRLSEIVAPGICQKNEITNKFLKIIREFHRYYQCITPISCFTIMPDHIHLIIRIIESVMKMGLTTIVEALMEQLSICYRQITCQNSELFESEWHDWIVCKDGQLEAFRRYIRENPMRYWRRRQSSHFFRNVGVVDFLDRQWHIYGNAELLNLPIIIPLKCSRAWSVGTADWCRTVNNIHRLGPGCAVISTFMSPCEKECGNILARNGGNWIVLHPEGFCDRWHPSARQESFCAQGRMLFASLYEYSSRKIDGKTLYERCHEMGNLVCGLLQGFDVVK